MKAAEYHCPICRVNVVRKAGRICRKCLRDARAILKAKAKLH